MDAQPIEDALIATVRELPAEKQQEVLDFARFLAANRKGRRRRLPTSGFLQQ